MEHSGLAKTETASLRGLFRWPPLWYFVFLVLTSSAVSYAAFLRYSANARLEELNELSTIANLKVLEIVSWKNEREGDAEIMSHAPFFARALDKWLQRGAPPGEDRQLFVERIRLMQSAYGYEEVFLFDAHGKPVLSATPGAAPPGARIMELARQTMRTQAVLFLDIGSGDDPGGMGMIAPILANYGGVSRAVGAAYLRMDPSRLLFSLLKAIPTEHKSMELLLVRRDGDDVLFLNVPASGGDVSLLRRPLNLAGLTAAMAVLESQTETEGVDYRGVPVFAALRKIPNSGWHLVAKMDRKEVYAPLRTLAWLVAGALVFLTALTGVALALWWRGQRARLVIAEKERIEKGLRAASAYARSLIEASLDPLVTISPAGKITDVNEATEEATGLSRSELIGTDFASYFTWPEQAQAGYRQVLDQGFVRDYPLTMRHRSGRLTDVLYNAALYRDEAGNIRGVFAAARDITARKRAEEDIRLLNAELEQRVMERTASLEAANRELEGFAYSVSHDLRVPLRAIDGFSHLVLKRYGERLDDEGKRLLNVVRDNTRKMGQLIDDILAFSRAGRLEIKAVETDMEALVREVWQDAEPAVAGREVRLDIRPLPKVQGDPAMLRQVWANLLGNAVKFTNVRAIAHIEVGGSLGLAANGEGNVCMFYVKDDGAGFDQQYAHKLFGMFQRLHGVDEFEGTGIGLAIVKRIVARHGGRVWAEGKVNEGALFGFALPASKEEKS